MVNAIIMKLSISKQQSLLYEYSVPETMNDQKQSIHDIMIDSSKPVSRSDNSILISNHLEKEKDFYNHLLISAFIVTTLGFLVWGFHQNRVDKITNLEVIKAERNYVICQSCGTELQLYEIKKDAIYCKICHNGYGFIDPKLTISELRSKIESKMIADGFDEKKIKHHINKLSTLYRWKKVFKW